MSETRTLSNGIRVVYERIPFVRSVSLGIWVKNGSRHETEETKGASHFIEHMLFKGTKKRSAKMIADEMDAIGGQMNAYTSKEYTCYHALTLDTHFDIALDILSDMFLNSNFEDEDISKERNVILEEISMYEDSYEELAYDILQESVWKNTNLAHSILGTKESISKFDSTSLKSFYKKRYSSSNIVLAITGNFDVEDMMKKMESVFCVIETVDVGEIHPKPQFSSGFAKKEKDIEQVHICMGYPGIAIGTDEAYALAVFNSIFGGGMSSRLFQKIREDRGLTYSVYSFPSNYTDCGIFSIYAGMGAGQTTEVISLILQEIEGLKKDPITTERLSRTKEQLKSNLIIGQESTSSRMSNIGRSTTLLNRVNTIDDIIRKVDKVTQNDIESIIDKIFYSGKVNISAVGAIDGLDIEKILHA